MTEEEKYNGVNLPEIHNYPAYWYRILSKLFFIFTFGLGSVFLSIIIFPVLRIFIHPKIKFQVQARKLVSASFRFFCFLMKIFHVSKLQTENPAAFKNFHSKIIVANHPSLLDFVYLMALIPNADCIVSEKLKKNIIGGVVCQAYITNSMDFNLLCERCKKTLDQGNNIIIFPEGTRTPRQGTTSYKKGAARIALYCSKNIQPVFIGGSDKYGLGKHNPLWSYNHVEPYLYDLKLLEEIHIQNFAGLSETIAAKRITDLIHKKILEANETYKSNHPLCKTINNVI